MRLLKIIFLLVPPLLCKMIFQFYLIAPIKLVFVTDIVDWDKGFFAYLSKLNDYYKNTFYLSENQSDF